MVRRQARSQGGGGRGGRTTPPVAHPKDFVPPFSNFVPPFSNFVPPFSNFVPPFSNFVPPLEYVDDVTRAMSKGGGGACECPRVGAFFKLMTSRGQCPRGGVRLVFHPSKFRPPPPPGWLATGLEGVSVNLKHAVSVGLLSKFQVDRDTR